MRFIECLSIIHKLYLFDGTLLLKYVAEEGQAELRSGRGLYRSRTTGLRRLWKRGCQVYICLRHRSEIQ
jgi:hypothetical protein